MIHVYKAQTDLEPECHIEVFRYIILRPYFRHTVCIDESSILQCGPAKECVVTYEGSDFTIGTSERDSLIDTTGEVCNAILKIVVGNLHNI